MGLPLIRLEDAACLGPAAAGGKASNLARLRVAGLPVPDEGWVILVQAFWDHLAANGLEEASRHSFRDQWDPARLEGLRASVCAADLALALREALTDLPATGPILNYRDRRGARPKVYSYDLFTHFNLLMISIIFLYTNGDLTQQRSNVNCSIFVVIKSHEKLRLHPRSANPESQGPGITCGAGF